MGFLPGPSDPFFDLMQPPIDETPAQKTARQKRELDAQRINDAIDEEIKQDRANAKKDRKVIKVLLLGQSESGESLTTRCVRYIGLTSVKASRLPSRVSSIPSIK